MWNKLSKANSKTFQLDDEPELIHVIKTGFENEYFIVHEDACGKSHGLIEICTKEFLEEVYKIKI